MNEEYLSIKEFADLVGVTQQSIYKRLNKEDNPLHKYFKFEDGKKYISKAAVVLYENVSAEEKKPEVKEEQQENVIQSEKKNYFDCLLELLEQQLLEKDRQLQEKDNQIKEKDKQIESLLLRLEESNKLVSQQQQLTAIEKKNLFEIEEKEAATTEEEPQKKKSFFSFWNR